MKILLLGATGRVGQGIIEYGSDAGLDIIAIARNRAKLQSTNSHLTIAEGDIYKPQLLLEALPEQIDAVMNVVGGDVFKPSTVVTDSVRAALTIMKERGIERYLGITGVAEMEHCGLLGNITTSVMRLSPIRYAVRDHDSAFTMVKGSGIDWTLAGCPYIRDGQHTGKYTEAANCFPGGFKTISPQDVADFLVKEVQGKRFSKQIVGIWN